MQARSSSPYGSWKSVISAADVARVGMGSLLPLTELSVFGKHKYWIERKSEEGGRQVVIQGFDDGSSQNRLPGKYSARSMVHEYGGGSYCAYEDILFFTNYEDQRVYRVTPGSEPTTISPEPDHSRSLRYADLISSQDGHWLIGVRERHEPGEMVFNELVAIPADGSDVPHVIAAGNDFYSSPKINPDGTKLAWLCWDHPQMPWHGTELWLADVEDGFRLSNQDFVSGSTTTSIFQPEWNRTGVLHFISDQSGWWNLYRFEDGVVVELLRKDVDFGYPQWLFGLSRYVLFSDGRIALICTIDGIDQLAIFNPDSNSLDSIDLPFNSFAPPYLRGDDEDMLWVIGGGAYEIPSVIKIDPSSQQYEVIKQGSAIMFEPEQISPPQSIEFDTWDGKKAYAFFYQPKNAGFRGPEGELPPLIVKSHGGPTGAARSHLQLEIQYWTNRGFAVVDVNYGGSTGFGREYRERLDGMWGVVDTNDCIMAANYLIGEGLVDGGRLIIRGGSAGGFTTLSALTFHDLFTAGASYYGVPDLKALAIHTHKFESHYLDRLLGPLPESEKLYYERSPVNYTHQLSCPMILLQGLEDKIVPPSQAEVMIEAMRTKGLPYAYVVFDNEGHGFRRLQNVIRSLEAEYSFYAQIFGFLPSDRIEMVEIFNLKNLPKP